MSETFLTAETEEELLDPTNFSVMALLGFFLATAGLFSIQYVQMMPVAIGGGFLGAMALLFSKRFKLGFFSKTLGFLALVMGVITTSYGLLYSAIENHYELTQARKTSEVYLENLSKGDLDRVFFLVGFPTGMADENMVTESPTKRAMNRLRDDPSHKEIQERKSSPKWVFVGLEDEYPKTDSHTYKLTYKDDSQSIPPYYSILVRKNCSKYDKTQTTVNWFVDKLETAKKP